MMALQANLRRYITGVDIGGLDLNAGPEWWWSTPIRPMALWIFGSMIGAVFFAALGWAAHARDSVDAAASPGVAETGS
jgi:hypothetical protein